MKNDFTSLYLTTPRHQSCYSFNNGSRYSSAGSISGPVRYREVNFFMTVTTNSLVMFLPLKTSEL